MSSEAKPESVQAYKRWAARNLRDILDEGAEQRYESQVALFKSTVQGSDTWRLIGESLLDWQDKYKIKTNVFLLKNLAMPEVLCKPWPSVTEKLWRKNVVENDKFPNEPKDGFITSDQLSSRISDLVRTTFTTVYLDGVQTLAHEISAICRECGTNIEVEFLQRPDGYHACHLGILFNEPANSLSLGTTSQSFALEVQIKTEFQSVLSSLLHNFYETRRSRPREFDCVPIGWQFSEPTNEFDAAYLGTMAQFLEAHIVRLR